MQVPPHPHIGLQTVSWLFQGLVLHRDSLDSRQLIRPGELNLMTAGRGITHSEESAAGRPPVLHGLQLWIALPEAERHGEPRFAHHADLPVVRDGAANVTVARAPADVVELRGAQRRGDHPGPRGLGGRALPRGTWPPRIPARRASAASRTPQAPLTPRP
jgi:redox-sensitive bicupin YhaK (pirin superfamily)